MNISLTPTLDEYVKERVEQLSDALDKGYEAYLEGRHSDTTAKAILDKVIAKRNK